MSRRCFICSSVITPSVTGRPAHFCSPACRAKARRLRKSRAAQTRSIGRHERDRRTFRATHGLTAGTEDRFLGDVDEAA